ncbi:MAG: hydroxymethylpyrimidine/phosphomethylpyrimidine kinase, partial [Deltaproteobacteria bacterium]|nr:hydroxymethylpyrimidine/phosphomethylpyrimidine kinase [Deltaproteobacteria bacterium]
MQKVLTIAGSDSTGGAGIQADLKTILSLGGYGMSVVTAVTAQDTLGIKAVRAMDPEFVKLQLDCVLEDIGADCVKTGMLVNAWIVRTVASRLKNYRMERIVVDPLLNSKDGSTLLDEDGRRALVEDMFPLTYLLTPNIP